jgi:hypothetical protein
VQRTTFALDERLLERIRRRARRENRTVQDCINELLRRGMDVSEGRQTRPRPWPTLHLGGILVDLADRDALQQIFDEEEP